MATGRYACLLFFLRIIGNMYFHNLAYANIFVAYDTRFALGICASWHEVLVSPL
jgi:hypothetical protein